MKNTFVAFIILLLAFVEPGHSQEGTSNDLYFEVNRVFPPFSITKEEITQAQTLLDLNKHYKVSWIREYISVEIAVSYQGETRKATGKSDVLTQEQKDLMRVAEAGTGISILVQYMPENTLKNNDVQKISFTLAIEPETQAEYPGGQQQLEKYLKAKVIDHIPSGIFTGYKLAAVKFTVDEVGQITDAHLFWSSDDEKTDEMMLDAVCNMPNWKPAEYAGGTKIKQEFAFMVGSMESCVVNLLNILQD